MKLLFLSLLFAVCSCQLAVAVDIAAVVIESDGNIANLGPLEGKLERVIQSLRNSTDNAISRLKQPQCGDGIWHQLVSINMSTADSQCPDGWVEENEGGVRTCGRGTVGASCQSVFFNNDHQMEYTKVCGRAIGYQYGHTDAFAYRYNGETIDQNYVDGLSVTYGSPRQHLWTFAAGVREGLEPFLQRYNCPCSRYPGTSAPSYLGNNWYCESGNPTTIHPTAASIFSSDPLWDGENYEGTCCSNGKSPPWFSVELSAPISDYIEACICSDEHSDTGEDVFINKFEIYIQ